MTYLGNSPGSSPSIVVSEYVATAGQTTFNASYYEYVQVYLNGMLLSASDYVANDGSTVVLAVGANAGDVVLINGYEVGLQGIKGDTGEQGLKGDKGDTGDVGPQGVKGDTGEVSLSQLTTALSTKQDTLVSGTNIKTIGGASILGGGDLVVSATDYQEFTTSGTWTKPAGATYVYIECCGGGGGGGANTTKTGLTGGGGGGAGVHKLMLASTLSATETITIGAGGAGGATGGANSGANGGNTTFGTSVTAYGGGGGGVGSYTDTFAIAKKGFGGLSISPTYGLSTGFMFSNGGYSSGSGAHGYSGGGGAVMGGGGGGGAANNNSGAGGISVFAGNGGAGNSILNTKGGNGTYPSGGGGASDNDGGGGDGAAGRVRVWAW